MKSLYVLLVAQFMVVYCKSAAKLPEACRRSDPEVAKCFLSAFDETLVLLRQGISQYKIPSFEPLLIPRFEIVRKLNDLVEVDAVLTNIRADGVTYAKISDFKYNLNTLTSEFNLLHPQVVANLDYKGSVKFGKNDFQNQAHLTITLDNITSHVSMTYKKTDDGEHFVVSNLKLKVQVQDAHIKVISKDPDDQAFLEFFSKNFNNNSRRYLDMMEPMYTQIMEETLVTEFNKLMLEIPTSSILVD